MLIFAFARQHISSVRKTWHYAINAWELASSRRRTSGFPEIQKIGYPEIRISGYPDFQISGFPDFRITGYPDFRISGFPDFRISGYPDFRISGYPDKNNFDELARKWSFCYQNPSRSSSINGIMPHTYTYTHIHAYTRDLPASPRSPTSCLSCKEKATEKLNGFMIF